MAAKLLIAALLALPRPVVVEAWYPPLHHCKAVGTVRHLAFLAPPGLDLSRGYQVFLCPKFPRHVYVPVE